MMSAVLIANSLASSAYADESGGGSSGTSISNEDSGSGNAGDSGTGGGDSGSSGGDGGSSSDSKGGSGISSGGDSGGGSAGGSSSGAGDSGSSESGEDGGNGSDSGAGDSGSDSSGGDSGNGSDSGAAGNDSGSNSSAGTGGSTVTSEVSNGAGGTVTTTTTVSEPSVTGTGTPEDPKQTETTTTTTETTTTTDENGNTVTTPGTTTTTVTTQTEHSGTNTDGAVVDYQNTETGTKVTDGDGNLVSESGTQSGSETTTGVTTVTETKEAELPEQSTTKTTQGTPSTETKEGSPVEGTAVDETQSQTEIHPGYGGDVTVNLTPGETRTEQGTDISEEELAAIHLAKPEESAEITVGENGETIETVVTVEEIRDSNDRVIGYNTITTVKTTTELDRTEVSEETDTRTTETTGDSVTEVKSESIIHLPEKPQAGETTDEATGQKTTVTVEELLDDSGNVVGYQSTTIVTDAEGNEVNKSTESIWGSITTTTTTVTTPITTTTETDTKVTTTTTTLVTTAITTSGQYVVATDREVTASMGLVYHDEKHGRVDMDSIVPTQAEPAVGSTDTNTDLYHRADQTAVTTDFELYDYQWNGEYGLESAIRIDDINEGENTWQAHQFVLVDKNGEKHYVYCADFEVSPVSGFRYSMENVEDADYYNTEAAQHIRAIALSGYWGTSAGTGSLAAVKEKLTQAAAAGQTALTSEEINSLTPGEALAATQAAIWYYGNSGSTNINKEDIVGKYYNGNNSFTSNYSNTTVQKMFNYLIGLSASADHNTTLINEAHFASGASVTVGNKVEGVTENGNDVYDTSVSFTLAVIPSSKDTLTVQVIGSDGKVKATELLSSAGDSSSESNFVTDGNGNYTIKNLQLAENISIRLNLSGTQYLEEGVYLYSSEIRTGAGEGGRDLTSQTFVGIASGTRDVDLNVTLSFTVDDPEAYLVSTGGGKNTERTDTTTEVRTDTTTQNNVRARMLVTSDVEDEVHREWASSWARTYEKTDDSDDDGGSRDGGSGGGGSRGGGGSHKSGGSGPASGSDTGVLDIADEAVPLGMLPKTGDWSGIWYLLAGMSGLGLAGTSFRNRKRRKSS